MQTNEFIYNTQIDPSANTNVFGSCVLKVANEIGALGDEDERIVPLEIKGTITGDHFIASGSGGSVQGRIYAVSHISTYAADPTSYLLGNYTSYDPLNVLKTMIADEFNSKQIGTINPGSVLGNFKGSFKYKFSKKLRDSLDRKITDPDYNHSFDIVVVFATNTFVAAAGETMEIQSWTEMKYQVVKRQLSDIPV